MSNSLLKGGYMVNFIGLVMGDTRSLDHSSYRDPNSMTLIGRRFINQGSGL